MQPKKVAGVDSLLKVTEQATMIDSQDDTFDNLDDLVEGEQSSLHMTSYVHDLDDYNFTIEDPDPDQIIERMSSKLLQPAAESTSGIEINSLQPEMSDDQESRDQQRGRRAIGDVANSPARAYRGHHYNLRPCTMGSSVGDKSSVAEIRGRKWTEVEDQLLLDALREKDAHFDLVNKNSVKSWSGIYVGGRTVDGMKYRLGHLIKAANSKLRDGKLQ